MTPVALQHRLLLGEMADLELYTALRRTAHAPLAETLDSFIETEHRHAEFWRKKFHLNLTQLDLFGRIRNRLIRAAVFLFGERVAFLLLEAIETHGVKVYLDLWETTKDPQVREGLRAILTDELLHEDEAATHGMRAIDPQVIRNAFLGFNDGSVEILGAVSGLMAALHSPLLVAMSGITVSVAGSLSMAAGAFLSTHSEAEIERMEVSKQRFLQGTFGQSAKNPASPWKAAGIVGVAYLIGALVPVFPFLFGATNPLWSVLLSGVLILFVSALLAFLSGMDLRRRVALNALIVTAAVLVSYAIGLLVDRWLR